jgi:hypothetical protein
VEVQVPRVRKVQQVLKELKVPKVV